MRLVPRQERLGRRPAAYDLRNRRAERHHLTINLRPRNHLKAALKICDLITRNAGRQQARQLALHDDPALPVFRRQRYAVDDLAQCLRGVLTRVLVGERRARLNDPLAIARRGSRAAPCAR